MNEDEAVVIQVDGEGLEIPAFLRDWLAEAWDEGRAAGHTELLPVNAFGDTEPARNPYRLAASTSKPRP